MDDLISVIVNVYNDEKTLKNCLISIISQTYRNMEIIIVDDGSTDGSSRLCDELLIANSKMKVSHQLHNGIAASRNKGLEMACGKYITFVNGSDFLDKNMLKDLYDMMSTYMVDMSICRTYTESMKETSNKIITFDKEDALRQLLIGNLIKNTPCGKLFNRDLFKFIDFSTDEADTLYKLIEHSSKIAFINKSEYYQSSKEIFSFNSLLSKDLRIMKFYPSLEIYCKCNIVKSIQNEFYNALTNNLPIIDEDKLYTMFSKIVKENDDDIIHFFSYVRKAHMYLLANDKSNYRIICPVLPDIYDGDENI